MIRKTQMPFTLWKEAGVMTEMGHRGRTISWFDYKCVCLEVIHCVFDL